MTLEEYETSLKFIKRVKGLQKSQRTNKREKGGRPLSFLYWHFSNFLIERAHCGFGTLGTETLGGFSEIGFSGETIHPS